MNLQQQRLKQSETILKTFKISNKDQNILNGSRNVRTGLSNGAMLELDQMLGPVNPPICQNPPAGGVTWPIISSSTKNLIPPDVHSRR